MKELLAKIFQKKADKPWRVPENVRVYCVGDIHGRDDLLERIHHKIYLDSDGYMGDKVIIYLGDYIDRGSNSKAVIDIFLQKPLIGFKSVFLRGNHEQVLLDFMHKDPFIAMEWFNFGGHATLESYGLEAERVASGPKLQQLQQQLLEKMPAPHLAFYQQLKYSYTLGDYFFVHAGVRAEKSLKRQSKVDMMWIRQEFLNSEFKFKKMIVHGHAIVDKPTILPNRIAIDTGAYSSGVLTCLVLEGEGTRFLDTTLSLE